VQIACVAIMPDKYRVESGYLYTSAWSPHFQRSLGLTQTLLIAHPRRAMIARSFAARPTGTSGPLPPGSLKDWNLPIDPTKPLSSSCRGHGPWPPPPGSPHFKGMSSAGSTPLFINNFTRGGRGPVLMIGTEPRGGDPGLANRLTLQLALPPPRPALRPCNPLPSWDAETMVSGASLRFPDQVEVSAARSPPGPVLWRRPFDILHDGVTLLAGTLS
jgi:hypothetical protein